MISIWIQENLPTPPVRKKIVYADKPPPKQKQIAEH